MTKLRKAGSLNINDARVAGLVNLYFFFKYFHSDF
jgi:hypothetical protein